MNDIVDVGIDIGRSARSARRCAVVAAVVAALLATPAPAKPAWDQVANIRKSAELLAELQRSRGALGAFQHIASCYRTHELASSYTAAFEGCLVLDYIHSKITAAIYNEVPADERQRIGAPDPETMIATMSRRIVGGFAHYKIADAEGRAFIGLVEKHGLPVYTKARFPDSAPPAVKSR
jgi:hypothetical protein